MLLEKIEETFCSVNLYAEEETFGKFLKRHIYF